MSEFKCRTPYILAHSKLSLFLKDTNLNFQSNLFGQQLDSLTNKGSISGAHYW